MLSLQLLLWTPTITLCLFVSDLDSPIHFSPVIIIFLKHKSDHVSFLLKTLLYFPQPKFLYKPSLF